MRSPRIPRAGRLAPGPRCSRLLLGALCLLLAPPILPAQEGPDLALPASVDLGSIAEGGSATAVLSLPNRSARPVYVELLSMCECLVFEPAQLIIEPRTTGSVRVSFASRGYAGEVHKHALLRSSDPAVHDQMIVFEAWVEAPAGSGSSTSRCVGCEEVNELSRVERLRTQDCGPVIYGELYYSPGCRSCEEFLARELGAIREASAVPIVIRPLNVMEPSVYELLQRREQALGRRVGSFPALVLGNSLFEGIDSIRQALRAAGTQVTGGNISRAVPGSPAPPASSQPQRGALAGAAALPVLAAGLLDGINPCAFTTLVFLVSALGVYGRTRGEILLTGIVFAAAVFATYYALGLGAFALLRTAAAFTGVARAIRWAVLVLLAVLSVLSFRDALRIRAGRIRETSLKLPAPLQHRIHHTIHANLRSASLVGGSALMGCLVSVFELACTGQVYLPTITWMVARGLPSGRLMLLVYNSGFIIPLLGVFILVYTGTQGQTIGALFRRHMALVKGGLGALFMALGILTVVL